MGGFTLGKTTCKHMEKPPFELLVPINLLRRNHSLDFGSCKD